MPMTTQLKFVHSADKLAEMRTKFHIIQAKLITSVWCFTVQCYHQHMADELLLPVEYFDVGVERNVSSLRKTRHLVRLVQLVLVAGGLQQAHNHSW